MFNKKLKKEDLEELKKREEIMNSYKLVVSALEIQNRIYMNGILPKYGCDMNKNYNINLKTGEIKELKPQQKKNA